MAGRANWYISEIKVPIVLTLAPYTKTTFGEKLSQYDVLKICIAPFASKYG